jgi:hypothetical protein
MSDGVMVIGIFIFIFLLWAFAGGPSRSISFAGPFITPITNEGQTQIGYGPQIKIGGTINLPGAALTTGERSQTAAQTATQAQSSNASAANTATGSGSSSNEGLVTITHIAGDTANPTGYVQISVSSSAGKDVDITNWSITSSVNKESGLISTGILVLQLGKSNTLQEIELRPGDKATIAPGASPAVSSFEANECSGYLTTNVSEYNTCVAAHANDPGFLLGNWYVYLGRTTALWKSSGDIVSLLDGSGNPVASYSY